jgi:cell division protease FtsH
MNTHSTTARLRLSFRAALLLPFATLLLATGCRQSTELPYSAFKAHIAADEMAEVRFSAGKLEGVPTAGARASGAPALWTTQQVASDGGLIALLDTHHVQYQSSESSMQGVWSALVIALFVAAGVGLVAYRFSRIGSAKGFLSFGRSGIRDAQSRSTTRFEDVAGVDEATEELEEVVKFLREPARFASLGARTPKGVLLVGPPGTGKTLLARAVAGEAGVPFFPVSGSEFIEVFVGVGAQRVRRLFARAKAHAPAIVFIDELDSIGKTRSASSGGANDEREHTLNQLLIEMDGFDGTNGLIVLAATNRSDTLDQALLRPGRFDRQVLVDRPDSTGREAILKVHARKLSLNDDVDLGKIARRTAGMAGADLENVLNEAALLAARSEKSSVGMFEIDSAIDRVVAGLERKNRRPSDKERRIVAYHEAGHALIAQMAPTADPVRKVSIIPRGLAALGYMQQTAEDRHLLQEDELMDRLAILLGGRAAEHVTFGKLSTGASNDLERASDLARRMVCEFGMSASVGPVSFARRERGGEPDAMSEQISMKIEREVDAILAHAFDRAVQELTTHRAALEAVSAALLDQGSLDRDQLIELMNRSAN